MCALSLSRVFGQLADSFDFETLNIRYGRVYNETINYLELINVFESVNNNTLYMNSDLLFNVLYHVFISINSELEHSRIHLPTSQRESLTNGSTLDDTSDNILFVSDFIFRLTQEIKDARHPVDVWDTMKTIFEFHTIFSYVLRAIREYIHEHFDIDEIHNVFDNNATPRHKTKDFEPRPSDESINEYLYDYLLGGNTKYLQLITDINKNDNIYVICRGVLNSSLFYMCIMPGYNKKVLYRNHLINTNRFIRLRNYFL